jgi:hypothetical protein
MESLIKELNSTSTIDVRRAAKYLRKKLVEGVCHSLFDAYQREIAKKRQSWETQYELIMAAGVQLCSEFLPILEQICKKNKAHDMITTGAGISYFRIKRKNLSDISPFSVFINSMNHSLACGFLYVLGFDKMIPTLDEQKIIIAKFSTLNCDNEDDVSLLYFLATACAGWNVEIVQGFLIKCSETNNEALKFVANSSLKGEYVKQHQFGIL